MLRGFSRLVLVFAAIFGAPSIAFAHRLVTDFKVLPDNRIQVEAWFDVGGDAAIGAHVSAYADGGELLAEGTINSEGLFVFPIARKSPLRVMVSAAGGHRREFMIGAEDLQNPIQTNVPLRPLADRSAQIAAKDVVLGISFVLAVAALVLSMRNAKRLRALAKE